MFNTNLFPRKKNDNESLQIIFLHFLVQISDNTLIYVGHVG